MKKNAVSTGTDKDEPPAVSTETLGNSWKYSISANAVVGGGFFGEGFGLADGPNPDHSMSSFFLFGDVEESTAGSDPVPEPATVLLLGTGLLGLVGYRLRHKEE